MRTSDTDDPRWGWRSPLPDFYGAEPRVVRLSLERFVRDAGVEQLRAWSADIPWLQEECRSLVRCDDEAKTFTAILEYELPRESRRPDVILLENGTILVMELKGKAAPTRADLDQVSAYARDLRCYHVECADRPVVPVLVPTRADSLETTIDDVRVAGPRGLHQLLLRITTELSGPPITPEAFLDPETLVGLRLAHAGFLDDLAVDRGTRKPTAPVVFLSGNGPLVEVLQDALSDGGGGGKVFVRGVKDYVKQYSRARSSVPPEHLLIFDEAQRAWDVDHVRRKHPDQEPKSEPEHFVEFAERIPEWCVVVGLIGTGQEIHAGEHGGIVQWRHAVEGCRDPSAWTIHAPAELEEVFLGGDLRTEWEPSLNLDTELRFHAARSLHEWVETFITEGPSEKAAEVGERLWGEGYRLLVTRDLEAAKAYAHERFEDDPEARYGLLASSKAKDLPKHGVDNSFVATRKVKIGPWYNAPQDDSQSCCNLTDVATEFSSQGLELDLAVLGWGSDSLWADGEWSARYSGRTRYVDNTLDLRRNVYRVLLTRGREGTMIFVPGEERYDETHRALLDAGARSLTESLLV